MREVGTWTPPIVVRESEGEFSTIRLANGTVETILFNWIGEAIATRRTYQRNIIEIQREHIRSIRAELEGN